MDFVPRSNPRLYRHHYHRVSSNLLFCVQELRVMEDEKDIIDCWFDGMNELEIAEELGLSVLTVIDVLEKWNL